MRDHKKIRAMEEEIIGLAIDGLIAAGYHMSVDYGDGPNQPPSQDKEALLTQLWACDEERLLCYGIGNKNKLPNSSVFLVYGEDGWDVICDHGVSLEAALTAANKRAQEMADG